jgi:hypothetical protein
VRKPSAFGCTSAGCGGRVRLVDDRRLRQRLVGDVTAHDAVGFAVFLPGFQVAAGASAQEIIYGGTVKKGPSSSSLGSTYSAAWARPTPASMPKDSWAYATALRSPQLVESQGQPPGGQFASRASNFHAVAICRINRNSSAAVFVRFHAFHTVWSNRCCMPSASRNVDALSRMQHDVTVAHVERHFTLHAVQDLVVIV